MKVVLIGAGRMGTFFIKQLKNDICVSIIDKNVEKAKYLASKRNCPYSDNFEMLKEAEIVAMILPDPIVKDVSHEIASFVSDGCIVLNMATEGIVSEETIKAFPNIHFIDAKIIGHAKSLMLGTPAYVVVSTEDVNILKKVKDVLSGYGTVVSGDSSIVPKINKIGSGEGIRAAVNARKMLKEFDIPKEWEDTVIYTVCAGTMRSYVENDLGEFAQKLADKLESE